MTTPSPFPMRDLVRIFITSSLILSILMIAAAYIARQARGRTVLLRRRIRTAWMPRFLSGMEGREPKNLHVERNEAPEVLEIWLRLLTSVRGTARKELVRTGRAIGLPEASRDLIRRGSIRNKAIAAAALGHFGDRGDLPLLKELSASPSSAASIPAVAALFEIDPDASAGDVAALLISREDWPVSRVSVLLREIRPTALSSALVARLQAATPSEVVRICRYVEQIGTPDLLDRIRGLLLQEADPEVQAAALDVLGRFPDPRDIPLVRSRIESPVPFLRIHAVSVLGKMATPAEMHLLEACLADSQWWVRYRAAKALLSLPFVGPEEIAHLKAGAVDRYAADMLRHVEAEMAISR